MLPPENAFSSPPLGRSPARSAGSNDPAALALKADLSQMFVLIEGILPFEACLYYQVLPLSIEGSCLNLGMVNLDDQAAADYVRRLVSYINCSILPRQIPSDWHREILSKFLSHSAKNRPANAGRSPSPKPTAQQANQRTNQRPNQQAEARPSFAEQPTLVVNAPDDLADPAPAQPAPPAPPAADAHPVPSSPPAQQSLASWQRLSPNELTTALLDRILDEGIGRLYLERQESWGRILWSRDGVLQSVLENVDPQVFQGVINELKLMMSLSLIPVRKPKQVELERPYRDQQILMRFRVIPGTYGEEATLQILRGAALRFYQQQQIEKLGRDALGVAHTLQKRLNEIRDQARRNLPTEPPAAHEALPVIVELLKDMERQVHEMISPIEGHSRRQ